MWTPPLPEHRNSGRDEVEDLLGKGHDQTACQGEKTLGTLGGVMALEGDAHLSLIHILDRAMLTISSLAEKDLPDPLTPKRKLFPLRSLRRSATIMFLETAFCP